MRFNEKAQAYNTRRLQFPTRVFASVLGFGDKAYFKATAGAEQPPAVDFDSMRRSPAPAR
jgi:LemA protein